MTPAIDLDERSAKHGEHSAFGPAVAAGRFVNELRYCALHERSHLSVKNLLRRQPNLSDEGSLRRLSRSPCRPEVCPRRNAPSW
jgi:hypothetical protein